MSPKSSNSQFSFQRQQSVKMSKNDLRQAVETSRAKVKSINVKEWEFAEKFDLFVQVLKFTN